MKACLGSMLLGIAVGAIVCSVYPIPMCSASQKKIRRGIKHATRNAMEWL